MMSRAVHEKRIRLGLTRLLENELPSVLSAQQERNIFLEAARLLALEHYRTVASPMKPYERTERLNAFHSWNIPAAKQQSRATIGSRVSGLAP